MANDIYEDLPNPDNKDVYSELDKLKYENDCLRDHIDSLEDDIAKLCAKITEMKKVQNNLSRNISELYKTAKAEFDRKDRTIAQLRAQLDSFLQRKRDNFSMKREREKTPSKPVENITKKIRYSDENTMQPQHRRRSLSRSGERDKRFYRDRSGDRSRRDRFDRHRYTYDARKNSSRDERSHRSKSKSREIIWREIERREMAEIDRYDLPKVEQAIDKKEFKEMGTSPKNSVKNTKQKNEMEQKEVMVKNRKEALEMRNIVEDKDTDFSKVEDIERIRGKENYEVTRMEGKETEQKGVVVKDIKEALGIGHQVEKKDKEFITAEDTDRIERKKNYEVTRVEERKIEQKGVMVKNVIEGLEMRNPTEKKDKEFFKAEDTDGITRKEYYEGTKLEETEIEPKAVMAKNRKEGLEIRNSVEKKDKEIITTENIDKIRRKENCEGSRMKEREMDQKIVMIKNRKESLKVINPVEKQQKEFDKTEDTDRIRRKENYEKIKLEETGIVPNAVMVKNRKEGLEMRNPIENKNKEFIKADTDLIRRKENYEGTRMGEREMEQKVVTVKNRKEEALEITKNDENKDKELCNTDDTDKIRIVVQKKKQHLGMTNKQIKEINTKEIKRKGSDGGTRFEEKDMEQNGREALPETEKMDKEVHTKKIRRKSVGIKMEERELGQNEIILQSRKNNVERRDTAVDKTENEEVSCNISEKSNVETRLEEKVVDQMVATQNETHVTRNTKTSGLNSEKVDVKRIVVKGITVKNTDPLKNRKECFIQSDYQDLTFDILKTTNVESSGDKKNEEHSATKRDKGMKTNKTKIEEVTKKLFARLEVEAKQDPQKVSPVTLKQNNFPDENIESENEEAILDLMNKLLDQLEENEKQETVNKNEEQNIKKKKIEEVNKKLFGEDEDLDLIDSIKKSADVVKKRHDLMYGEVSNEISILIPKYDEKESHKENYQNNNEGVKHKDRNKGVVLKKKGSKNEIDQKNNESSKLNVDVTEITTEKKNETTCEVVLDFPQMDHKNTLNGKTKHEYNEENYKGGSTETVKKDDKKSSKDNQSEITLSGQKLASKRKKETSKHIDQKTDKDKLKKKCEKSQKTEDDTTKDAQNNHKSDISKQDTKSKKTKDNVKKDPKSNDESTVEESDRVLRSAARRNSRLQEETQKKSDAANSKNKINLNPFVELSDKIRGNLTHDDEIPVLHISEDSQFKDSTLLNLENCLPVVTSSPVKSDLNGSLGSWNGSNSLNETRIFNMSSGNKRRRVILTMVD